MLADNVPSPTQHWEEVEYPVMEHFYTVQGEGAHTGRAAYFIRLGGCDVGCHWCDVKESWPMNAHPRITVASLAEHIRQARARTVVVTGGEPLLHDCGALTMGLKWLTGCQLHIETSGTQPLTGDWDWVTLSPKKFKPTLPECFSAASELKVVIFHPSDFPWAEQLAEQCPTCTPLFLQPEWERKESATWIVDYVKRHPQWQISLQTHKFLAIP